MNTRNGALAVLAAAAAFAAVPATAPAASKTVTVRIEGKSKTIFEGPVTPAFQTVDGHDGKGPQKCDGTNGGAKTNGGGIARLTFKHRGVKRLKATAPKSIRSNALVVKVS